MSLFTRSRKIDAFVSTVWFSAFPGRFVDACRWIMRVGPVFVEGKDQGTVVVLSRKSMSLITPDFKLN